MRTTVRQYLRVSVCNLKTYKNQCFIYYFGLQDIYSAAVSIVYPFFYKVIPRSVNNKRFCVYQIIAHQKGDKKNRNMTISIMLRPD